VAVILSLSGFQLLHGLVISELRKVPRCSSQLVRPERDAERQADMSTAKLLLLWAFLDNRDLWYGLLDGLRRRSVVASTTDNGPIHAVCTNEVAFNQAIRLLLNYCLAEKMENLTGYVVHPVVHRWAR
ncbi:hypothetical protein LTR93_012384, partial [Exophiala xenobiotica]